LLFALATLLTTFVQSPMPVQVEPSPKTFWEIEQLVEPTVESIDDGSGYESSGWEEPDPIVVTPIVNLFASIEVTTVSTNSVITENVRSTSSTRIDVTVSTFANVVKSVKGEFFVQENNLAFVLEFD